MQKPLQFFQVSQKALLIHDGQALIMECSGHAAHQWDLPGGHIDEGEMAADAFKRELYEEIKLADFTIKGIIDYESIYILDRQGQQKKIIGIVMLVDADTQNIVISSEHTQTRWIGRDEVDQYEYVWPCMARAIKKGFHLHSLLHKNEK